MALCDCIAWRACDCQEVSAPIARVAYEDGQSFVQQEADVPLPSHISQVVHSRLVEHFVLICEPNAGVTEVCRLVGGL